MNHTNKLLQIAKNKFDKLSVAERELFIKAQKGKKIYCSWEHDPTPSTADTWGPEHSIRSECLEWLCTDSHARTYVHHTGIHILGAKIEKQIRLQCAKIPFKIDLHKCSISKAIILRDAKTKGIGLNGSHIGGLLADRAIIAGSLHMSNGFHAMGRVRLLGADIKGQLSCRNGRFENPKGQAINANRMTVKGSVFMDGKFHAMGEVKLLGAIIGGNLDCAGGRFEHPGKTALNGDSLLVHGSAFLRDGFSALGTIDLTRARIDGPLQYHGITTPEDAILDLEHAFIGVLWDEAASWPKQGHLRLHGLVYNEIHHSSPRDADSRIEWLELQRPSPDERREKRVSGPLDDYQPQPYEQLASVLRATGKNGEAKTILKAKAWARMRMQAWKRFWPIYDYLQPRFEWIMAERKKPSFPVKSLLTIPTNVLSLLFSFLYHLTLGSGYRPYRPAYCLTMLFFIGVIIFSQANNQHHMTEVQIHQFKYEQKELAIALGPSSYPAFNPWAYSADTLIPFINLHQEDYWLPDEKCPGYQLNIAELFSLPWCGEWLRWYLWIHICAGWIFTGLLIIGITGMLQRRSE